VSVEQEVAGARAATAALFDHLDRLDDLAAPSLLPGWSRAHVVAHLAGNARSHVRMLDGCLAGEVVAQYPGDADGRAAEIAQLAVDPAAALAAHRQAGAELDLRWAAMPPAHWDRLVLRLDAGPRPAFGLAWSRWKEVEVHRVDLRAGYRLSDWEPAFARRLLASLLERAGLPAMTVVVEGEAVGNEVPVTGPGGPRVTGDTAALAGWLSGRDDGRELHVRDGPLPRVPAWS
jgi:maleylpyruvate isomerase